MTTDANGRLVYLPSLYGWVLRFNATFDGKYQPHINLNLKSPYKDLCSCEACNIGILKGSTALDPEEWTQ